MRRHSFQLLLLATKLHLPRPGRGLWPARGWWRRWRMGWRWESLDRAEDRLDPQLPACPDRRRALGAVADLTPAAGIRDRYVRERIAGQRPAAFFEAAGGAPPIPVRCGAPDPGPLGRPFLQHRLRRGDRPLRLLHPRDGAGRHLRWRPGRCPRRPGAHRRRRRCLLPGIRFPARQGHRLQRHQRPGFRRHVLPEQGQASQPVRPA
jgi:hypothetical protein